MYNLSKSVPIGAIKAHIDKDLDIAGHGSQALFYFRDFYDACFDVCDALVSTCDAETYYRILTSMLAISKKISWDPYYEYFSAFISNNSHSIHGSKSFHPWMGPLMMQPHDIHLERNQLSHKTSLHDLRASVKSSKQTSPPTEYSASPSRSHSRSQSGSRSTSSLKRSPSLRKKPKNNFKHLVVIPSRKLVIDKVEIPMVQIGTPQEFMSSAANSEKDEDSFITNNLANFEEEARVDHENILPDHEIGESTGRTIKEITERETLASAFREGFDVPIMTAPDEVTIFDNPEVGVEKSRTMEPEELKEFGFQRSPKKKRSKKKRPMTASTKAKISLQTRIGRQGKTIEGLNSMHSLKPTHRRLPHSFGDSDFRKLDFPGSFRSTLSRENSQLKTMSVERSTHNHKLKKLSQD